MFLFQMKNAEANVNQNKMESLRNTIFSILSKTYNEMQNLVITPSKENNYTINFTAGKNNFNGSIKINSERKYSDGSSLTSAYVITSAVDGFKTARDDLGISEAYNVQKTANGKTDVTSSTEFDTDYRKTEDKILSTLKPKINCTSTFYYPKYNGKEGRSEKRGASYLMEEEPTKKFLENIKSLCEEYGYKINGFVTVTENHTYGTFKHVVFEVENKITGVKIRFEPEPVFDNGNQVKDKNGNTVYSFFKDPDYNNKDHLGKTFEKISQDSAGDRVKFESNFTINAKKGQILKLEKTGDNKVYDVLWDNVNNWDNIAIGVKPNPNTKEGVTVSVQNLMDELMQKNLSLGNGIKVSLTESSKKGLYELLLEGSNGSAMVSIDFNKTFGNNIEGIKAVHFVSKDGTTTTELSSDIQYSYF